jgi:hypothetical protein
LCAICTAAVKPALLTCDGEAILVHIPAKFFRRHGRQMILMPNDASGKPPSIPDANESLIDAIAKAHRWQQQLEAGEYGGVEDLAKAVGVDRTYVGRVLRLTALAPDIVEAILRGCEPSGMSLRQLQKDLPFNWEEHRERWTVEQPSGSAGS